jgi:hypothetical protein
MFKGAVRSTLTRIQLSFSSKSTQHQEYTYRIMSYQELAVCIVGIYVFFLTWGITQERVSTTPYNGKKFKHFVFLNTCQALIASIISYAYIRIKNSKPDALSKPLIYKYLQLATFHCLASPFGYAALKHIDYPTIVSCFHLDTGEIVQANSCHANELFDLSQDLSHEEVFNCAIDHNWRLYIYDVAAKQRREAND